MHTLTQEREAQLAQYNYILVVGEAEKEACTVNVRTRDNVVHGMFKVCVCVRACVCVCPPVCACVFFHA